MAKWNYYIKNIEKISEGEISVGTIFKQERPHDTKFYKITKLVAPGFIEVQLLPPAPDQQFSFMLSDAEQQTNLVYNWRVDLRKHKLLRFIPNGVLKNWMLSFAKKHVLQNIKPSTEQNFLRLKKLLETGKVVLQDGRITTT